MLPKINDNTATLTRVQNVDTHKSLKNHISKNTLPKLEKSKELNFKFEKQNLFGIVIKSQAKNIMRSYKFGFSEWFKESEYYDIACTCLKKETVVSEGKYYGYLVTTNGIKIWKTKIIKQYYENKKLKSVETLCGNPNDSVEDFPCGKQYFYNEKGRRKKTLNYDCRFENDYNCYKKIVSEGLHGLQYFYNDNGKKEIIESYDLGKKHGWQNFYNDKSKLYKQEIWYNGTLSNTFVY